MSPTTDADVPKRSFWQWVWAWLVALSEADASFDEVQDRRIANLENQVRELRSRLGKG